MTLLYIVRHAHAGEHGDPRFADDSLRPLTSKGRKQFGRVVNALINNGVEPSIVATSPLVRCRQTADMLVEALDPAPGLIELESLAPGSDLDKLIAWSNARAVEQLAWVGHAPDVDKLTTQLVGMRAGAVSISKGSVVAIQFDGPVAIGQGELVWFVTPKLFKR